MQALRMATILFCFKKFLFVVDKRVENSLAHRQTAMMVKFIHNQLRVTPGKDNRTR